MMWRYRLYGLETDSPIDLGPLPGGNPGLPADVTIELGLVAPLERDGGCWFENRDGVIHIDLRPAGRFIVRDGTTIVVDAAEAGLAALRWRLLGIAFGAVLHQRGIMALHATVVAIGERTVGLTGVSGAGKSTLAGWLQKRGHAILIDDVCAVVPHAARVIVEPGNGLLRLWDDAMGALGRSGGERLDPECAKFEHASPAPTERLTLDALVELGDGDVLAMTALDAGERMGLCLRSSYCRDVMLSLGRRDRNLAQCAAAARSLAAFALVRPRGFDHMDAVADRLEAVIGALP